MSDKVSVIITTRNEGKNIENCIKSILDQTYTNIEIIVVDNDSTDKTKHISKKYTDLVFDKGPERSSQRNFGIEKASGQYSMYIDADMILAPNLIESCVKILSLPECNVAGVYIPEVILGKNFWSSIRRFERKFYNGTVIDAVRIFPTDYFYKTGGFDLSLTGPEDWDLDKKLKKLGQLVCLEKTPALISPVLTNFLISRGINRPETYGNCIFHNESDFNFSTYFKKKSYYATSFDNYILKWGKQDPDLRKQLGLKYRYFGVFFENGKWKSLLSNPLKSAGMYFLRLLVGLIYLFRKTKKKINPY